MSDRTELSNAVNTGFFRQLPAVTGLALKLLGSRFAFIHCLQTIARSRNLAMPDFNVIENVSQTLVELIGQAIRIVDPTANESEVPSAVLHDLRSEPTIDGSRPGVVAITLVEAREDGPSRNRPDRIAPSSGGSPKLRRRKPPMALRLRYLITPWANENAGRAFEHRLLGRVLQLFHENSILSGAELKGSGDFSTTRDSGLSGSDEALKVSLAPLSFEEQTRFWHAVQLKYRPSLTYEVRVVNLDVTLETSESIVHDRILQYGEVAQR